MKKYIIDILSKVNSTATYSNDVVSIIQLLILLIACWLVYFITRRIMLQVVHKLADKTEATWDDRLVEARFFAKIALILPILILLGSFEDVFRQHEAFHDMMERVLKSIFVINTSMVVTSFVTGMQKYLQEKPSLKDKPLYSYAQLIKILIYLFLGIILFSILTDKTPLFFLSAMGAMSAIVLLVFKDTILGFVGSIQLATNDMVRVGDWITMEKYGADGNVEEITLATIKVQNFDKTITTIPTYSLISDSFKNWRGMEESSGRRIKRAINIKTSSVHFCNEEELETYKNIRILKSYIEEKVTELSAFNTENGYELNEVNGRRLTNIGVFRKYLELYLKNHHLLNTNLTCMVRQLPPTEKGLPIEVYTFSKDKEWVTYETIMADIFDHIFAIIPSFQLEIFQSPTGSDFKSIR